MLIDLKNEDCEKYKDTGFLLNGNCHKQDCYRSSKKTRKDKQASFLSARSFTEFGDLYCISIIPYTKKIYSKDS